MAGFGTGHAIFSTNLGRFPPRAAGVLPARIILRSSPEDDLEAKLNELQAKFPVQCKAIEAPISNIYDYFDGYDQELHGEKFLHAVLTQIFERNLLRRQGICQYAHAWTELNSTVLPYIFQYELNAFTDEDMEEYGKDFLRDVLQHLRVEQVRLDGVEQGRAAWYAHACERIMLQTQERHQQRSTASSRPFQMPELRPLQPNAQRNRSAPPIVYPDVARSGSASLVCPSVHQVIQASSPVPWALQDVDHLSSGAYEQSLRSAPLVSSIRSRMIYRDPQSAPVRSSYSTRQQLAEPHTLYHPANLMRYPPKSRVPIHEGPSNDDRVLERQGIPRYRKSFGEGRIDRGHFQTYDQQMPQPKHYSAFQQMYVPGPLSAAFSQQDAGSLSTTRDDLGLRAGSSQTQSTPGIPAYGPLRQIQNTPSLPSPPKGHLSWGGERRFPASQSGNSLRSRRGTMQNSLRREYQNTLDTIPSQDIHQTLQVVPASPPQRRLSNATSRPSGAPSRSMSNVEHQITPGSYPHRANRYDSVSDRKAWIGGLRDSTTADALADTLKPWGPVKISEIKVSSGMNERWSDIFRYAFAEFDDPHQAADAIKALHDQPLEAIGYPITLRPAYARVNDYGGSPQKHGARVNNRTEYRTLVSRDTDHLPRSTWASRGDHPAIASVSTSEEREQKGGDVPLVGTDSQQSRQEAQNRYDAQQPNSQVLTTSADPLPSSISKRSSTIHECKESTRQDFAAGSATSYSLKADEDNAPLLKSETPSLGRKKPQKVDEDELAAEKTSQVKQRKDMLSSLRTEKVAPATDERPLPTNNDEQVQITTQAWLATVPDLRTTQGHDPEDTALTVREDESAGQVSPMPDAPTHGRQFSAASIILSTDPTSYAHSEHADIRAMDTKVSPVQGSSRKSPSTLPQADCKTSVGPVDASKLENMLTNVVDLQTPNSEKAPVALQQATVEFANDGSSSLPTQQEPDKTARSTQQQDLPIADKGARHPDLSPPSERSPAPYQKSKASVEARSAASGSQSVGTKDTRGSQPVQQLTQTPHAESVKDSILRLPDLDSTTEIHSIRSTHLDPVSPGNSQSQKASSFQVKRAPSKDPSVLIAVPRTLPSARRKPPPKDIDVQTDTSLKTPAISGESQKMHQIMTTQSFPTTETSKKPSSSESNFFSALADGQTLVSSTTEVPTGQLESSSLPAQVLAEDDATQMAMNKSQQAHENVSASDSVATLEAEADVSNLVPSASPKSPGAVSQQEHDTIPLSSSEQPAVQQKKAKKKKGKKKAKKSKSKSSHADTPANNEEDVTPGNGVPAPIVERPFVSDEGQDLPLPIFAKNNHSSMSGRSNTKSSGVQKFYENLYENTMIKPIHLSSPSKRSSEQTDEASPNVASSDAVKDWQPPPTDVSASRRKQLDEYCEQNDKASPKRILGLLGALVPQPSTEVNLRENVGFQVTTSQTLSVDNPHRAGDPSGTVDEARRRAHYQEIDEYCQKNDPTSHGRVSEMLNEVVPEFSNEERQDHHRNIDNLCQDDDEAARRHISEMLSTITPLDGEGSNGPRVEEISDGETQLLSSPTAPLKRRRQSMLSSPDASPEALSGERSTQATRNVLEPHLDELQESISEDKGRDPASFPATRRTSPERGRPRSFSLIRGSGAPNQENMSPSRLRPGASLSYKDAAATSPTRPIQPGELIELVPKEGGQGESRGQGYNVIRQRGGNDPWRVPSKEQPWGAKNKPRGKSFAEPSEGQK